MVAALLVACTRAAAVPTASPQITSDESDVQSAVINQLAAGYKSVVVLDSTVMGASHYAGEDYAWALRELRVAAPGLREDFELKREQRVPLLPLTTRGPATIVNRSVVDGISGNNPREYWTAFRERFPGSFGRIELSRVGFSADGKQALVLAHYQCGGRCGGTRYYLLERVPGGWQVLRHAQPHFY